MTGLLILGGTTEARLLCEAVANWRIKTTVSLAGVTQDAPALPVATRVGGFGGVDGLVAWLRDNRTRCVIDATHPFAAQMPWHACHACADADVRRLRVLRPAFPRNENVGKTSTLAQALEQVPHGSRVLATSGRKDIEAFSLRRDLLVFLRTIEPVADLPAHVTPLLMRPPFSGEAERTLMRQHRIDVLIAKDSGGVTAPKLAVAEALNLKTILLERPLQPAGPTVQTVEQAVAWLWHVVGIAV